MDANDDPAVLGLIRGDRLARGIAVGDLGLGVRERDRAHPVQRDLRVSEQAHHVCCACRRQFPVRREARIRDRIVVGMTLNGDPELAVNGRRQGAGDCLEDGPGLGAYLRRARRIKRIGRKLEHNAALECVDPNGIRDPHRIDQRIELGTQLRSGPRDRTLAEIAGNPRLDLFEGQHVHLGEAHQHDEEGKQERHRVGERQQPGMLAVIA